MLATVCGLEYSWFNYTNGVSSDLSWTSLVLRKIRLSVREADHVEIRKRFLDGVFGLVECLGHDLQKRL